MPVQTIPELFMESVRERPRPDCFSYRLPDGRWVDVSTQEALQRVIALRHGLKSLGVAPGDRVALLSENRLEWALADLAIVGHGAVTVPVYPTLLPDAIAQILADCEPTAVFVSTPEQAEKLARVRSNLPSIRDVITFDPSDVPQTMTLERIEGIGRNIGGDRTPEPRDVFHPVDPEDLASIIYTSGTTGDPKGVMLTHANFVSNVLGADERFDVGTSDRALSFLPLSHVFERMVGHYYMLHAGVGIAYAERLDTVPRDMQEVKPTIVVSVPRLYEKIYGRVLSQASSGPALRKRIFFWARQVGKERLQRELAHRPVGGLLAMQAAVADRLVFSKLRARVGGRLKLFISGGAPLPPKIAAFFHAAGLPIMEGYGLTETSPVLTCNYFGHVRLGSVGQPLPRTEIRIAPDGEIQARGPQVMRGYYRNEAATREVLDDEGWFSTGDIGHLDDDGYLFITDRKKDVIVTAGGKNVAPQPVEKAFEQDRFVSQAVVVGNQRPYLVVLLVPTFEMLEDWARGQQLPVEDRSALLNHPQVRALFEGILERVNADLPRFNQVKSFALLDREFTLEANEMTPTLKVRRFEIDRRYRDVIDSLYPDLQDDEP
ncbi:MAG: long-chain fatty acid--CoA ligase [Candidatus Krumholzibacteriia bacterium]